MEPKPTYNTTARHYGKTHTPSLRCPGCLGTFRTELYYEDWIYCTDAGRTADGQPLYQRPDLFCYACIEAGRDPDHIAYHPDPINAN